MQLNELYDIGSTHNLSSREREILRSIVNMYILNANPVGSRPLSKYLEGKLSLSPATLRNVMSDLEDLEYISHPHTSAGRIPTDKGYRFYVDTLKKIEELSEKEINTVHKYIALNDSESETVLKEASKVLSVISNCIGIVRIPYLKELIVKKIELIPLSSTNLLVVIALDSNIVRTVTLEADFEVHHKYAEDIARYINEKISGKTLGFLRMNFAEIINENLLKDTPLMRLFIDSVDKVFENQSNKVKIITSGTQNIINQPEFEDLSKIKSVIELIEDEDMIIHLLDNLDDYKGSSNIFIGSESGKESLKDYSIIIENYQIGSAKGSIGLIGPKRMNYGKMMSIVKMVSSALKQ